MVSPSIIRSVTYPSSSASVEWVIGTIHCQSFHTLILSKGEKQIIPVGKGGKTSTTTARGYSRCILGKYKVFHAY